MHDGHLLQFKEGVLGVVCRVREGRQEDAFFTNGFTWGIIMGVSTYL